MLVREGEKITLSDVFMSVLWFVTFADAFTLPIILI